MAGLNVNELSAFLRVRGQFSEQAAPTWLLASVSEALDANAKPVMTMAEQNELE